MNTLRCKVIIVGDSQVGKTSMQSAFQSSKQFQKNYNMTLGVDFSVKQVKIPETDISVELYVFDTSGDDIYQSIRAEYWKDATMVVYVYDTTNPKSFKNIPKWIKEVTMALGVKRQGVLVGCKADLDQQVKRDQAVEFAADSNLAFFDCSAANNLDVDAPFNFMAMLFHKTYEERRLSYAQEIGADP